MSPRFKTLALICAVGALAGSACGLARYNAERNYLGQMLYDYEYPLPLEEVWPAAMSVSESSQDAGQEEPWGRSHQTFAVADGGAGSSGGHVMALRLADGGTRLVVLSRRFDGGTAAPAIFQSRNFDQELRIMRLLRPEDAERFYSGSLQAGRRAESR